MIKLDIPYRSQWAGDAKLKNGDCGPTCLAMILNYRGVAMTPDGVYEKLVYEADDPKRVTGYTNFGQLEGVGHSSGLMFERGFYADQGEALHTLRATLDAGIPGIALVKYLPWKEVLGNLFDGGHFVVVTGYDDEHIFIHDPLFGNWVAAENGAHIPMSTALFAAGWGGFVPEDDNPNWMITYNGTAVTAGTAPRPRPQPKPEPVPIPPTPITPTPQPQPTSPVQVMDDVNRRIRALAAYRWAEPPDFANPADLQLWLDNLGDFGLEYEVYRVKSGDSLSALAARYYGGQNRWPAIKAYNELPNADLWLDQRLMIPRMGTGDGHSGAALPHDTADFSKSLEFLMLDPEQTPLDYNALMAESSKGIGTID